MSTRVVASREVTAQARERLAAGEAYTETGLVVAHQLGVTAAALLGHDPMVYAKTYAHHYADDLRKASEILSGLYSDAL